MKKFTHCLPLLLLAAFLLQGCTSDNGPSSPYIPPTTPQTIRGSWTWQNPLPQGNQLTDISFVDAQNGWAIGVKNTILHTTDGGQTWTSQGEGTSYVLMKQFALDANTAWVIGTPYYCGQASSSHGGLLLTTNGGQTWIEYPLSAEIGNSPRDLCFADAQNGWLVSGSSVFRTTDGGRSWTWCESLEDEGIAAIQCLNRDEVWAAGINLSGGMAVRSSDGGISWAMADSLPGFAFTDVCFVDANTGWITAALNDTLIIRHTTDGGASWASITQMDVPYGNTPRILFTSPTVGWTWPSNGLMHTTDGGRIWTRLSSGSGNLVYTFVGENLGWTATSSGYLRHSTDGGNSWTDQGGQSNFNQILGIVFNDEHEGWCVDGNYVYRTTDGGREWIAQNIPQFYYSYVIKFYDASTGWVLSGGYNSPQMARTTNGGNSWGIHTIEGISDQGLRDFCFADRLNGWVVGQGGGIARTHDGGVTWVALPCSTAMTQALKIAFADTLRGCILYQGRSSNMSILRTTDGGLSWNATDYPFLQRAYDMTFNGPQSGWIVGVGGMILRSEDAGESWTIQSPGTWDNFRCVYCVSPDFVWVGSDCGTAFVTVDRGQTWQRINTPCSLPFIAITAVNNAHAWAVGYNSSLLHFTPEQGLVLGQE